MMKPSEQDFQVLSSEIGKAVDMVDEDNLSDLLWEFKSGLVHAQPSSGTVKEILDKLKGGKQFGKLCETADSLLDVGLDQPFIRRLYAQGMIEFGQLNQAQEQLERLQNELPLSDKRERSEVVGLLGRVHKQRFVRFQDDKQKAAMELNASIEKYSEVYDDDPAWHGPNLVALVHRAEKEGFTHGLSGNSEDVAKKVMDKLRRIPEANHTHWVDAAIGEVSLALKDWDAASKFYGLFVKNSNTNGFSLASAARNLKEIWQIPIKSDSPSSSILLALNATTLSHGEGQVGFSPKELSVVSSTLQSNIQDMDSTLEAILGNDAQVPLQILLSLVQSSQVICQVVDRYQHGRGRKSGGTGFLLNGGLFKEKWQNKTILVTNNHVLSTNGEQPSVRKEDADAVFHYLGGEVGEKKYKVETLIWESPREELDVTFALLEGDQDLLEKSRNHLRINIEPNIFGPCNNGSKEKVFLIGHPDGRGLEFSLSDNSLVDHDLLDENVDRNYRRIHYKAPTEKGMSGSPILSEKTLQVIGVHRAGGKIPPIRYIDGRNDYKANEGVWVGSIRKVVS